MEQSLTISNDNCGRYNTFNGYDEYKFNQINGNIRHNITQTAKCVKLDIFKQKLKYQNYFDESDELNIIHPSTK